MSDEQMIFELVDRIKELMELNCENSGYNWYVEFRQKYFNETTKSSDSK